MYDLNTINRLNGEAIQTHAARKAAEGQYVLLKFSGLNFETFEAFPTERERNAAACTWTSAQPGNRADHLNPPAHA